MFACASGDVFIGSINTTDAHYICNTLGGYIETIRVNDIIQIFVANASNMRIATNLLG
jgi:hypothetical protein